MRGERDGEGERGEDGKEKRRRGERRVEEGRGGKREGLRREKEGRGERVRRGGGG